MRTFSIVALLASMAMGVPAMAQTMPTSDYSANNGTAMDGHPAMNNQSMMRHNNKPHAHALGSMRHPTVGNTANQRVNGG